MISIKALRQKIEALQYYSPRLIDSKHLARVYREFIWFTESICIDFKTVSICYTDTQIVWKYYSGSGKMFREGTCKYSLMDLPVDLDILIPELEAIAIKFGKIIVNNRSIERAA